MTPTDLDRLTYDEEYWPPPTHPLRLVTAILVLFGATIVGLLWFAGTAGLAGGSGDGTPQGLTVPRVVGMSESLATTALVDAGFEVEVVRERNVSEPAGTVFRQSPEAGAVGDGDDVVQIVVSGGDDYSIVPQLTGSLLDDVPDQLYFYVLNVGEITYQQDMNSIAGEVLSQDPAPGTEVPFGTTINLIVSEGPPPVEVPDVVGMTQSEAERVLAEAGFRVSVVQWYSSASRGTAVSTTPRRGEEVPYGSTIRLYISRGPAPVTTTVPPAGQAPPTTPPSTPPTTTPPPTTPPAPTAPTGPAPPD